MIGNRTWKHIVHIIWEEKGTRHAAALGLKGILWPSLVAKSEAATGVESLNLPEERKRLKREIQEAKPSSVQLGCGKGFLSASSISRRRRTAEARVKAGEVEWDSGGDQPLELILLEFKA